MKKALVLLVLVGAAASAVLFFRMKTKPEPASREQAPPEVSSPIRVEFAAVPKPEPPLPEGVHALKLLVFGDPKNWPAGVAAGGEIELLLRLPVGVELVSAGWKPAPLPQEEEKDSSGPWKLFQKSVSTQPTADGKDLLVSEVIGVKVGEGINWILTARARMARGSQIWQAFGVIFATNQKGKAEFHSTPKPTSETQRAQAN